MSSVKALVTKSETKKNKNKKKRYIMREKPKLGKPLYGNLVTFNEKFFKKCKTTHSLCPNLREM